MKHILNNTTQGTDLPWVTLDENGVHYSGIIEEGLDYVDLGLPSGILWAKCNVGATTETEYGKYFQWGDTVGYEGDEALAHSTWATAPFNNGSSSYDSTYFASVKDTVCSNGVLAPQYDAAYQATNGAARMPTQADFEELTANTTVEWTSMTASDGSTVYGGKFTNKTDETKYIFIPASGYAGDGSVVRSGSYVYVLSSSLYTDSNFAWFLYFSSSNMGVSNDLRYRGYSVRGVKNA